VTGGRNLTALCLAVSVAIAGCGEFNISEPIESIKRVTSAAEKEQTGALIYGLVAGDEPASVSIGNTILLNRGTAADAAAAMALTLAVTFPSRAGLGGGGVCLVGGGRAGPVKVLDFIPKPGTGKGPNVDRPSAVPALLRGVAVLQARYGRLGWSDIVAPAIKFAREGVSVTRPFAADFANFAIPLFADPVSRSVFAREGGRAPDFGDRIVQLDLRTVLAQVGARGAGEFYNGFLARRILRGMEAAGGSVTAADLRNFLPKWREPQTVRIGDDILHAAPPPATSGLVAARIMQLLTLRDLYRRTPEAGRPHLVIEAAKRAFGERAHWLRGSSSGAGNPGARLSPGRAGELMRGYDPGKASPAQQFYPGATAIQETDSGTSFVVVDSQGMAVACTLTMYHAFGTGRMAPGVGILLAASPDKGARNPFSLGPLLVTRAGDNAIRLAVAASGGGTTASGMADVLRRLLLDGEALDVGIAGSRLHHSGLPDTVVIEDGELKERVVELIQRGQFVKRMPWIGRVNAAWCPKGLPSPAPNCAVAADPRAPGMALTVDLRRNTGG